MNPIRQYLRNKKGINTILAALLMVVIVVVASVMVYAWSTGLLGALMGNGTGNVGKEALNLDSSGFPSATNVTLYIRNSGTSAVSLQSYYITDSNNNAWQLQNYSPSGQPIPPNGVLGITLAIGSGAGQCGSTCQYTGTYNGATPTFNAFVGGNAYGFKVVTTRNTPFTFTVTR